MNVGEIILAKDDITINKDKASVTIKVTNSGARPIQVGSHLHFFEVNSRLVFEREKSYGYRLDIPAGTAVRFEAGETKVVGLVEISGRRKVMGANGLVNGFLDENKASALNSVKKS